MCWKRGGGGGLFVCLFGWAKDFLTRLEEIVYFNEVMINQAKVQSFIGSGGRIRAI